MSNGVQVERIKFFIYAFGLGSELGRAPNLKNSGERPEQVYRERVSVS